MFSRLTCKMFGHRRGVQVNQVTSADLTVTRTFQCPRCGRKTVYRKKPKVEPTKGNP